MIGSDNGQEKHLRTALIRRNVDGGGKMQVQGQPHYWLVCFPGPVLTLCLNKPIKREKGATAEEGHLPIED